MAIVSRSSLHASTLTLNGAYSSFEYHAVKLRQGASYVTFINIYRPPKSANFIHEIQCLFTEASLLPGTVVIAGDFNSSINDKSTGISFVDQHILDVAYDAQFIQHVSEPTHNSNSVLDLIFTSANANSINNLQLRQVEISDHYLITASICATRPALPVSTVRSIRNYKRLNCDAFEREFIQSTIFTAPADNANDYAKQLCSVLTDILDRLVPIQTVKNNLKQHRLNWLSAEALQSRRLRRKLEKKYRRTALQADHDNYRNQCRKTNKIILQSRKEFVNRSLAEAAGNPRRKWTIYNGLLHRTKPRDVDNVNNLSDIGCEALSVYFHSKIMKITQTINAQLSQRISLGGARHPPASIYTYNVSTVTEDEVVKLIREHTLKPSPLDFVPAFLIREYKQLFASCITRLANMSFSEGVFPTIFKTGRITPILKKTGLSVSDPANYRPITNLNTIGKILERLMLTRLKFIVDSSSNLNHKQSAYRTFHSTETAMTRVISDLRLMAGNRKPAVLLALDVSAAFDTLDHDRLLARLTDLFGISGTVLQWIKSYLSNRSQFVHFNGISSTERSLLTGVPQGSVLGPFLFSAFTTPLGQLITSHGCNYHQYADDVQVYTDIDVSASDPFIRLKNCVEAVITWHLENGLLLNPDKTEAVMIGTYQQLARLSDMRKSGIDIDHSYIAFSDSIRSLGAAVDGALNFDTFVSQTVRYCNLQIRALRHIRHLLDESDSVAIARALVLSKLDYCNAILYGTSEHNLNRLQCTENFLARVVTRSPCRTPHLPLLKSLHWLPIRQRIEYKMVSMAFKARHHKQPLYLSELVNNYEPSRTLRSTTQHNLSCPVTVKTEFARKSFAYSAPALFNSLPVNIKLQTEPQIFHKLLKTYMFDIAYNC